MHERIADEKRMRRGGHDLSKGELVYVSADFLVKVLSIKKKLDIKNQMKGEKRHQRTTGEDKG